MKRNPLPVATRSMVAQACQLAIEHAWRTGFVVPKRRPYPTGAPARIDHVPLPFNSDGPFCRIKYEFTYDGLKVYTQANRRDSALEEPTGTRVVVEDSDTARGWRDSKCIVRSEPWITWHR